jgi:endonuclease G
MKYATGVLFLLLTSASAPLRGQTLEQRVRQLERDVAQLRQELGIRQQGTPSAGTSAPGAATAAGAAGAATAGAATAAAAAVMPASLVGNDNVRWGFPGGSCVPLNKEFFIVCHDAQQREPEWVTYHLTRADLAGGQSERTENFRPDPELPPNDRAELNDYRNSGYDRGHMAPAADFKRSDAAMSATFFLSNMTPQRPNLNRRIWAQLEERVRNLARSHGSIWIFTGPVFLDANGQPTQPRSTIGRRVAVPTHFYKVILCEHASGAREMYAYMLPNQLAPIARPLDDFAITVRAAETASGLNFFSALPDAEQQRLETLRRTLPTP